MISPRHGEICKIRHAYNFDDNMFSEQLTNCMYTVNFCYFFMKWFWQHDELLIRESHRNRSIMFWEDNFVLYLSIYIIKLCHNNFIKSGNKILWATIYYQTVNRTRYKRMICFYVACYILFCYFEIFLERNYHLLEHEELTRTIR